MDKRLDKLLKSGAEFTDGCMIDTYNQQVQQDTACAIRTNINTANHHYIVERDTEMKGNYEEPNVLTPKRTEYGKKMRKAYESGDVKMSRHDFQEMRPRTDGVSNTITSVEKDNYLAETRFRIRKLTERECFRLMGVGDNEIDKIQASGVSRSQQYKMAGNSIVVDVLFHLFRKIFAEKGCESEQLSLF